MYGKCNVHFPWFILLCGLYSFQSKANLQAIDKIAVPLRELAASNLIQSSDFKTYFISLCLRFIHSKQSIICVSAINLVNLSLALSNFQ